MGTVRAVLGVAVSALLTADIIAAAEPDGGTLAGKAQSFFKTYCHRCHGPDASEGGFNYVLDHRRLIERRRIVPGDPAKSRLFRRLIDADTPMPPVEEKLRPGKDDIALIKRWIEDGVPSWAPAIEREFISQDKMLQAMQEDIDSIPERDRRFTRYFTLTHLHNAGLSAEELKNSSHALCKLINSLSWGKHVVVPKAIGPDETILRIDLRDYQWNEQTWNAILERNPYGVLPATPAFEAIAENARCKLPYVRTDWFVASASRPPLYHDILQVPTTEKELEKLLRLDLAENIRQERVARAGFNGSGVSQNNRLIERHESGNTVYWRSYDFAGNTSRQNLFAHPLGPDDGFQADGGEIIFSLPNGLQGYMLVDGRGRRIDKGPTAIVSDPRRPDRAVENGLSCISCHANGIIEKTDQILAHVLGNQAAFSESAVDSVTALYPPPERMTALMRADAQRFQEAAARTGPPSSGAEPIAALARRFEQELDLRLAAAESGLQPTGFLKALDDFPHLAQQLGPLRQANGTVQRQVFVEAFGELVTALRLGKHVESRGSKAMNLVRQSHDLLQNKADPDALLAFTKAVALEPDNALAHAGRADALRDSGDLEQAIAAYSEAIRLDPLNAGLLNNRAMAYQERKDFDRALADFNAALRLQPRFAVALHNRGALHFAKDELDRAIADYTEALRIDPRAPATLNNRGLAYLEKEDFDRASADFDAALSLQPRFAVALNNRGLANHGKKQLARALADFTAATEIDPGFARAYFNRAAVLDALGDRARAAADRKRAIQLDSTLD